MNANAKIKIALLFAIKFFFAFVLLIPENMSPHDEKQRQQLEPMIKRINGNIAWKYDEKLNRIYFYVSSPERGWIAIGLNDKDHIVGSDLFMISRKEENICLARCEHHFVTLIGEHPRVEELKKRNRLINYSYVWNDKERISKATIVIKSKLGDLSDQRFKIGQKVFLIFAYSRESDFLHHSIYREHFPIEL